MNVLGLEFTAHTFGAGVVNEKKVLANEKASFTTSTATGMIPNEVKKFHFEHREGVVEKAVAGKKIDLVACSQGPGLGHTLSQGLEYSREVAKRFGVPLFGVNHCVSHIEIGRFLCGAKNPVFLYVSGANTQIISFEGGRYRVFGETLDIGAGNLLDKCARELGLGFPGGPKMYELSLKSKKYVKLPYSIKGMDVSFSGMLTHFKKLVGKEKNEDLAYSLQETAFDMLIEASERAMAYTGKKELLLGGGVAASKILREKADIMCRERGAKSFVPEVQYCVDNGAMIGYLGLLVWKAGEREEPKEIKPYWRTDDVDAIWLKGGDDL